jgi:long-chain fatty acid transport protein
MNNKILKSLLGATCLSLAVIGSANAGGFSRGNADTDILYEEGNFNVRTSVTYVSPTRKISKANGNPNLVGTDYAESYVVPSAAMKMNITDNVRCAGTMVNVYGGDAKYAEPKNAANPSAPVAPGPFPGTAVRSMGKVTEEFTVYEMGLTCAAKFQAGKGNLYLLGGGFMESFQYDRQDMLGLFAGPVPLADVGLTHLDLGGREFGYRVGVAYDIPEIAFRTELMYRSGTSYGANGSLSFPVVHPLLGASTPALGMGDLPQSVELSVQSGIAPGWLAFGSVKWTDWSVTTQLISQTVAINPQTQQPAIQDTNDYFWRDGWTVTGGIGHAFSEKVSGLVAFTWDRGVGTGWDLSSDAYTLSAGGSFKDSWGGELRAGVGLTYLASAEETKGDPTKLMSVDSGYAWAVNLGYAVKW